MPSSRSRSAGSRSAGSRSPRSRRFRAACAIAAASTASSAVFALAGPAAADPTPPRAASETAQTVIASERLAVAVADDFPRVLSYTDKATGARLLGSTRPVTEVTLNGKPHKVQVKGAPEADGAAAAYTLAFPDLPGVEIDARLSVRGRVTTFKVTAVRDTEGFRVGTIDIPGHDLVSVGSSDGGAETAFTKLDPDATRTADKFGKVTTETPADQAPVGASYALVNTGQLAAAVESNSTDDKPGGATGQDGARFWHRATKGDDGATRVGVWSGQWVNRGADAPEPAKGDDLPWAKVVVTPDANGDKRVDWQDGAVAFRDTIATKPKGSAGTPDRVITHIPFNFASQAQHPFLRTLDDVKRVSLATDGLGQQAILKGYASEGHDSAHPDYGGNINKRAGGLTDLNKLLREGKKWGATFGVHVNATEAYPEANAFDEKLVDKTRPGWNWLNQSYYMDQRRDINSGDLASRFKQLRQETDPNLSLIYIDVYYTHGWIAEQTAKAVKAQGFNLATEWADKFERDSLWSHWANDLDYGPKTNKGLNSQIIRFIRNSEKDIWNADSVLGQTAIDEFEGWTGENDWNAFYDNVWQHDLPAKYLQHERITRWDAKSDDITFTGGVRGTVEDGKRTFYDDGRKVLSDTSYLLPWDGGKKLYHYNKAGGTTSWAVPGTSYTVYKLTDNGRVKTGTVRADGGKVTLKAEAGRPYVLYPTNTTPKATTPEWGEGTHLKDPGFHDANLDGWSKAGTVRRDTDKLGRQSAELSGASAASVSQRVTGLDPAKRYTASVWAEVEPGKDRRTTLSIAGKSRSVDRSTLENTDAGSSWHGTFLQRVKVTFSPDAEGRATLKAEASKGSTAKVRVADARIVANAPAIKPDTIAYEDFEDVDQGWGPFVKGSGGGVTDPRTHLALKHAPYTQSGWNGKLIDDVLDGARSLKTHEGDHGLVHRTTPATVPMVNGRSYKVSYDYQASHADSFDWVTGYDRVAADGKPDSVETRRTPLGEQRTTGRFEQTVTAGCGDTWVGLRMRDSAADTADFALDNFTVEDLGPAEEKPACATLNVAAKAETLEPGEKNEVTATFANHEATEAKDIKAALTLPDGWTAEPTGPVALDPVAPGAKATATWQVTPPADTKYQTYKLSSKVTYAIAGESEPRDLTADTSVRTLPPPPAVDTYASDMDWTAMENGWGPAEKDMSNGETAAGDGKPLTINGTVYEKGLGTAPPGTIRYYLGGKCASFTAKVGQDDSQGTRGSVQFSVAADGSEKVKSPVLKAADDAWTLTADVTGAKYVDLVTGDGGDGPGNDHADWGGARFHCGG
ncbi:endo-alpha-N-acetylgalactosaminidase family protein [Streptomyces sp. NPDC048441]|uniref:endo-alpha-N-acetylgalactosaminidase family protein n=1 Tax=Streptomyces sp. NPDC048441 TaxID=3365552 RepID=UPI003714D73B